MADVISHRASECTVCKDYVLHISEASVDNNESYLDAVDRWESNWVLVHEHEPVIRQNTRLSHNLDNCQDEISALRERIRDLEATPSQPTFAAVAAVSGDKPLTRRDPPAPPAPCSVSKKPAPMKQQAAPSMAPAAIQPATNVAGPSSDARAVSKDKGKGRALPGPYIDEVPAGIPSFKDDPYGYSLTFDDDKYDDEYAAAPTSDTAVCVAAILAGNSVSSSREGGEPAVLHPGDIAEFQLTMEALETAHRKGKMDLLASLPKVVSLAHKAGKNQSPLEKCITKV